jgi:hypothetical protein
LIWAALGLTATASNSLSSTTPYSQTNPLAIWCTATGAPSETGTANYYLVLTARYENHGSRPIAPIGIRFDFRDRSGNVVASHTVIDSAGLAAGYANSGRWQLIGYPINAVSLRCLRA